MIYFLFQRLYLLIDILDMVFGNYDFQKLSCCSQLFNPVQCLRNEAHQYITRQLGYGTLSGEQTLRNIYENSVSAVCEYIWLSSGSVDHGVRLAAMINDVDEDC